ncbi:tyrosine-type recombinase/integrase [Brachybacterium massiliense]|uniref:tyrosine-type recombinase/integrase n=1 Tax=Brachybacterium massiliense TaxID=1755098 RepID=UPI000B3BB666|nr:tyrosine-type recombinase/integrase [Brachybacterium massiliense]
MAAKKPRPRRQYGTGSVSQRADGKWVGRFDAGYTRTGNRRRKTVVATTEAECKRRLKKAIQAHEDGTGDLDTRTTVKAWCDEWLPREQKNLRPASFTATRSAVTQWIVPAIGHRKFSELTAADVRKIHKAMRDAGRAPSSITRTHAVTMKLLKDARREGHPVTAAATDVPPPSAGLTDRAAIPVEDALKILGWATEHRGDKTRWAAALLQGMRQAECLGLTWAAVDLEAGTADISWQRMPLTWQHGCGDDPCRKKRGADCHARHFIYPDDYEVVHMHDRVHWARPKSTAGHRIIPLVPWMVGALEEWRKVAPSSPHDLVWPRPDGLSRDAAEDLADWKMIVAASDVAHPAGRPYVLHEARHTTATLLHEAGIDSEVIRMIVGHSSMASTRGYLHLSDKRARQALEQIAIQLQLTA